MYFIKLIVSDKAIIKKLIKSKLWRQSFKQ
jgi:hypothetical protein